MTCSSIALLRIIYVTQEIAKHFLQSDRRRMHAFQLDAASQVAAFTSPIVRSNTGMYRLQYKSLGAVNSAAKQRGHPTDRSLKSS